MLSFAHPLVLRALLMHWLEADGCMPNAPSLLSVAAPVFCVLAGFGIGQVRAMRRRRNAFADNADLRQQLAEKLGAVRLQ